MLTTPFNRRPRFSARAAASLGMIAVLLTAACASDLTDPGSPELARQTVATVTVDPSSVTGIVGQTGQFSATLKDAAGNTLSRTIAWSSRDTTIVRIDANGFATGVGVGTTRVIASAGGKSGYSTVTVNPIPVASVVVTPGTASGAVGDSAQLTATMKDANGNVLAGRAVTWASNNPAVATVNASGMGHAMGAGSATLTAISEGQAGQATVTVTAPPAPAVAAISVTPGSASGAVGDSGQFSATVMDASGAVMTGQTVVWSSSNTSVATVSTTGMAHAVGGGTAAIIATSGGKSAQAAVTVSGGSPPPPPPPATAASVSVNPTTASVSVAQTVVLSASVLDASGNVLAGQPVTWTSSNPTVATVVGGLVTGSLAGNATITATSGSVSGSASMTVTSVVTPPLPSGAWPNAPASYPQVSDQSFSIPASDGWQVIWNDAGNGTAVTDLNAPLSAPGVWQVKYPAGFAGGSAPATVVHPLSNARHFYSGMWWKPSSPWQGHNSNVNKIQFLTLDGTGGDMYLTMYGPPGGPYALRVCLQFPSLPNVSWLVPNVNNVAVTLGQWHRIEWLVDYDQATIQFWMDGTLLGDYRNVVFPAESMVQHAISPTWGGAGDVKSETDYYWFDHVVIKGY